MIRYIRDLRLIPIALIASACLLTLKVADLAFNGSSLFVRDGAPAANGDVSVTRPMPDAAPPAGSKLSWAQQMFNFPDGSGVSPAPSAAPVVAPVAASQIAEKDNPDITGSVTTEPAKSTGGPASALGPAAKPAPPPSGMVMITDGAALPSGAERAILERLQQRREELDTRARELDIRESLIQGAEKRMDAKLAELKEVESQIKVETVQKSAAANSQLKGLVTMYEAMKPRDAAKIFNGLDANVLLEVASQINPRQMADIVAQMAPEVAERLTVELADKAQQPTKDGDATAASLPKIEGMPATP
jgi:flagellar motility protein MotE (MotC chaperone)